jgi:bifunctional non-homologous end joining protein LigD
MDRASLILFIEMIASLRPSQGQRKGRIFIDYSLQSARRDRSDALQRSGAPVAAPVSWEELRDLDSPTHWRVGDARALVKRATSTAPRQPGVAGAMRGTKAL